MFAVDVMLPGNILLSAQIVRNHSLCGLKLGNAIPQKLKYNY